MLGLCNRSTLHFELYILPAVKQTLYTLFLLASVGTIVVVATNPKLAQQGAALVGLGQPEATSPRPPDDEEDHLTKFMRQHSDNPYSATSSSSPLPSLGAPHPSFSPPITKRPAPALSAPTDGETTVFGSVSPAPVIGQLVETPRFEPIEPAVSKLEPIPTETTVLAATKDIDFDPHGVGDTVPDLVSPFAPPIDHSLSTVPGTASTAPKFEETNIGMGVARSTQIPSNDYRVAGPIAVLPIPTGSDPWTPPESPPFSEQDLRPPVAEPVSDGIWGHQHPQLSPTPLPEPPLPSPPQPESAFNDDVFPWNVGHPVNSANTGITDPGSLANTGITDPGSLVNTGITDPGFIGPGPVAAHPEPRTESQFQLSPSVMLEEVPVYGTEMVARVGTRVILMCDILTQLRRHANRIVAENIKNIPPEQRAQIPEAEKEEFVRQIITANYPALLQEQIMLMLVYNDFVASRKREDVEMFERKIGEEFDQNDVPKMMKEFGVKNIGELKQYLKTELGSSLEQERRLKVQANIAQQWMFVSVRDAEKECTYDEMMDYYVKHRSDFEKKAKVQWRELVVLFDKPDGEREAWEKLRWMGNQVATGTPFDKIAEEHSDGFTASKGGLWDWTQQDSLTSEEIERAIFTMPPNTLSQIIRGQKGFHIVMVVERIEASITPFIDAQKEIRDKITMQRRQRYHDEYFAELKRRYPTIVLRETIDFNPNHRTASR